ncbi:DUF4446 family protein [Nocardioides mangrovicus]|uniref:DUF4446 family protein n=1 Tax=Nocardioides mangrovicus TaxID=2478913 RepID=A0A3L8NZD3_9ACTN|nr:DUF4446 family protein [Nocardioides mangrovicus]RLV48022.1 DUF4446 family protein [Nocardioides mangrovicus]
MAVVLSVLALLVALVALGLVLVTSVPRFRRLRRSDHDLADVPDDVPGLRSEVAGLRLDLETALRHLAVVRYDAFDDMGGHLSWSVALLDDRGSGMVLTSIHGRQDTRSYAKPVTEWRSELQLSPEEEAAVGHARG